MIVIVLQNFENFGHQVQGHSQHPTENKSLVLLKYKSERLTEPSGGSPDVVHLLKYAF